MSLYPLKFEPIYKFKVWGGRRLAGLGRALPGGPKDGIGESWEIADLAATSASGGGEAARSVVVEGPLAGRTLGALIDEFGPQLMGDLSLTEEGTFPLLVKYLDAKQNLSVQVHPSQEYAQRHSDVHLKSEAWYIVDCEPGAVIYKGIEKGVTLTEFRRAIEHGRVEDLLIRVPVAPGECHYLPTGTCHALGAGLLVAEIQTPSDTTFRVYDWGRTGRELHIDQALECIHLGPADTRAFEPRSKTKHENTTVESLIECDYFFIEKKVLRAGCVEYLPSSDRPYVWMVIRGAGRIDCTGTGQNFTHLSMGQTLLLPPEMKAAKLSVAEETTLLEVTFPRHRSKQCTDLRNAV